MSKTFANLYLDGEKIAELKESTFPTNERVKTMEYYMNRKGLYYLRSPFGKLSFYIDELIDLDLKIGETYRLKYSKNLSPRTERVRLKD